MRRATKRSVSQIAAKQQHRAVRKIHLKRDESSQSQPNQKYALMAGRIIIHYMINGGFLGAGGEPNRDNNYILDLLIG
jgi:hypothetical protein